MSLTKHTLKSGLTYYGKARKKYGLTDKQKASREGALGSSDAPIVCGVSDYGSPLELYYKLHGELPRYDEHETWEQKMGHKVEPIIAELVAEDLGLKIRRAAPAVHPHYKFMTCNLDFEIVRHPRGPGILEIKRWSGKPFSELPDHMTLQVVHQMAVKGRDWAKVAVQFLWGKPVVFDVERDTELEDCLITIEAQFMARVAKGEPPTEDWTPQTVDLLKRLYPRDSGKTIQLLPNQAIPHLDLYRYGKEQIALGEARKAEAEGWFKSALQDASTATIEGFGQISWKKARDGTTFDKDRFEKDHPDLFKAYQKPTIGARRFLIQPKKETNAWISTSPSETTLLNVPDLPPTDPPSV